MGLMMEGGGVAHGRQQVCSACAGGGKYLEGWVEGKGCMERRGLGKVGGGGGNTSGMGVPWESGERTRGWEKNFFRGVRGGGVAVHG